MNSLSGFPYIGHFEVASTAVTTPDAIVNSNADVVSVLARLVDHGYVITVDEKSEYMIATVADLRKQPFRFMLFGLISNLEVALTEIVSVVCDRSEMAFRDLRIISSKSYAKVHERFEEQRQANLHLTFFECLDLIHKLKAIRKKPLRDSCFDGESTDSLKSWETKINDLRNDVCHSKDYLTRRGSNELRSVVDYVIRLLEKLEGDKTDRNP